MTIFRLILILALLLVPFSTVSADESPPQTITHRLTPVLKTYIWSQSVSDSWQVLTPDMIPPINTWTSFIAKVRNSSNHPIAVKLLLSSAGKLAESPTQYIWPGLTGWTGATQPIKLEGNNYRWELTLIVSGPINSKTAIAGMQAFKPNSMMEIDSQIYVNNWSGVNLHYVIARDLSIKAKFDLRANTPVLSAFGRIHLNSIPMAERVVLGNRWQTFTEDFTVHKGDVIELLGKHNGWTEEDNYVQVVNFRVIWGDFISE